MAPVSLDPPSTGNDKANNIGAIAEALQGTTILITGAAGFVGVALVQRLLCDANFAGIKKVICLIRGETVEKATARLPESLQRLSVGAEEEPARLVVLTGDCGKPDFGLQEDQLRVAMQADIVIHAAGDTRFTLPLKDAMASIVGGQQSHTRKCDSTLTVILSPRVCSLILPI